MPIDFSKMKSRANAVAEAKKDLETPRSGGAMGGIFDLSKAPFPVESWRFTEEMKDWEIDILALPTENPDNPMVRAGLTDVGEWHFHVSVDVHQFLAGSTTDVVCLKQYGKKCPACELFFEFHNEHNKGLDKNDPKRKKNPYAVSKRSYMLIRPRGRKNPEDKIYLYNASGAPREFVDALLTAANSTRGGNAPVDFAHPENGAVVLFDTVKGNMPKHYPAVQFGFRPRPKEEGMALWNRTFPLDTLLKLHTASEIEEILFDAPKAEEEPREASSQGRRDEYRREEQDAPDTQDTRRQQPPPPPDTDKVVEDGKWAKPEPEKVKEAPKQGSKTCPEGFTYGVTSVEENKRECRKCELLDLCVDNK